MATTDDNISVSSNLLRGELLSYKKQLEYLKELELTHFLELLLKQGRLVPELVMDVAAAARRDESVTPELLAELIKATKSVFLFKSCEERFRRAPNALITVMTAIRLPEVEQGVCDFLYNGFQDGKPFWEFDGALDALIHNGGQKSVDTLEILLFQMADKAGVSKLLSASIVSATEDSPLSIEQGSYLFTDVLLKRRFNAIGIALLNVRTRLAAEGEMPISPDPLPTSADAHLARAAVHMEKAAEYSRSKLYEPAANSFRNAAEAFCKAVHVLRVNHKKNLTDLEGLKTNLYSQGDMPEGVRVEVVVLQQYGNFGSHDQAEPTHELDETNIAICFKSIEVVERWAKEKVRNASARY